MKHQNKIIVEIHAPNDNDSIENLLNGSWKPNYDVSDADDCELSSKQQSGADSANFQLISEADLAITDSPSNTALLQKLAEFTAKESQYLTLIAEYEATVSVLEADKRRSDSSNMEAYARQLSELQVENTRLRSEKQEVEQSFQLLHKKYEQIKTLQSNAIKNEQVLKNALAKSQSDLMTSEARFLRLKTHAQQQLDAANGEITRIRDEASKQNLLLAAKLSLSQTKLSSVSQELAVSKTECGSLQDTMNGLCQQVWNP